MRISAAPLTPLRLTHGLLALMLLAATGCSGCSERGRAAVPTADANSLFSAEERAAMRKSVRSRHEYRELLQVKTLERQGAKVKYPAGYARSKKKREVPTPNPGR